MGFGSKFQYLQYLRSQHWRDLRLRALRRDGFKCCKCPCKEHLQVHHVVYRRTWFETRLDDLQTLCEACHSREHGKPSKTVVVITKHEILSKKKLKQMRKEQRNKASGGEPVLIKERWAAKRFARRQAAIRRRNDWSF